MTCNRVSPETASSRFFRIFRTGCQLLCDGCDLLDLVFLTDTLSTYPPFVSNWNIGFALTASPFLKDQKGTKKSSPHRTAFATLRFPRSGPAPWARRHGPSMAHRGSPGIHAGRPTPQNLLSASREGWQIKSTAPRGGRPAGLFGSCVVPRQRLQKHSLPQ